MIAMEYKEDRSKQSETEERQRKTEGLSQLVIEENTIYEIDLDCQYRKDCNCKECKCNKTSGSKRGEQR